MRGIQRNDFAGTLKRNDKQHLHYQALILTKRRNMFLNLSELSRLKVSANGEVSAILEDGSHIVYAYGNEDKKVYLLAGDGSHSTSYAEQMRGLNIRM